MRPTCRRFPWRSFASFRFPAKRQLTSTNPRRVAIGFDDMERRLLLVGNSTALINLVNGSGNDVASVLDDGSNATFTTSFLGTSDVSMNLLSYSGIEKEEINPIPALGNNPGYLTNFVGSAASGTGNGVPGDIETMLTDLGGGTSLQINFNIPIGPTNPILFGDIDGNESVSVQAFDTNGNPVSLTGWTEQNFTGGTGIVPDSTWARWNATGGGATTGTFTAPNSGNLDDPLNVLTPNQSISELILTQSVSSGNVDFQVLSVPALPPAIDLVNGSGQHAAAVLQDGSTATFTTSLLGTNDVSMNLLSYAGLEKDELSSIPAAGNNPAFLTNYVGSSALGTGDGTPGDIDTLLTDTGGGTSLEINFAVPIGPTNPIVFGDIDLGEQVTVQAFDNGTPVSLSGWAEQNYTGDTGIDPDSTWATWDATTGTFTGSDNQLADPLNVLTPNQSVTELVVTQNLSPGSFNFQVLSVPRPSPAINLLNSSDQDPATILPDGSSATYTTSFLGTNDVSMNLLSSHGVLKEQDLEFPVAGNNPSLITGFLGSTADGTGNGDLGDIRTLETDSGGGTSVEINFAIPIGPSDPILFGDIDLGEQVTVQAFDDGAAVSLAGWTEQNFTGNTGIIPDSTWATWNAATGTFTGTDNQLDDPLNVLTPAQSVTELILTQNLSPGSMTFQVLYAPPPSPPLNLINSAGQDAATVLSDNSTSTFTTSFLGTNDVSMQLLSSPGIQSEQVTNIPVSGNNPAYLTGYVGIGALGTGDGSTGDIETMLTDDGGGTSVEINFAIPIGPANPILFGDIDGTEQVTVQAYDASGNPLSTAGWTAEEFTGETGVIPNSSWASWDPAAGTLTAPDSGNLNDPLNVLIPDQDVSSLVITQNSSAGSVNFQILAVPQLSPVVNIYNQAGLHAGTALANDSTATFNTSFLGTNDVTMNLLGSEGMSDSHISIPVSGNNPGDLTGFIGSSANGTGDGTAGDKDILETNGGGSSLQMNFSTPIGSADQILVFDVDERENVTVQAFDNGTPLDLTGWTNQNFTGDTGIEPDSDWASWTVGTGDPTTGYLDSPTGTNLDDPINALTPAAGQSITELILTQNDSDGTVSYQVLVPGASLTAVSGAGDFDGTGTLTATLESASGAPLADEPVTFSIVNGTSATPYPPVMTDANGVATLTGAELAGFAAGDYSAAIVATFAGDAADSAATASGDLTVNQASPVITWENPVDITYGTPLGNAQLDATASVAGTFVYSPGAGTVLDAGPGQTLSATFTPSDTADYLSATATATINVQKATPTSSWTSPADITFGTALGADQLDATASVAGSFVYTPAAGTVLDAGAGQVLSATFTPDDTNDFNSFTITTTINVLQATPAIIWPAPADIDFGTALGSAQLDATASVAGDFAYSPGAGTILESGPGQTLSATFTPSDTTDYTSVTASTTINVLPPAEKVAPVLTWANPADIVYGMALGSTQLNATASYEAMTIAGIFTYSPASGVVLDAGQNQSLTVEFVPTDSTDFSDGGTSVTINVSPAPLTVIADPESNVYGASLPALAYQVTGFVNGDTASVLSGAPSLTTSATSASGVGDYSITVGLGTLSAANYDFPPADLMGNTLKVLPAPLTITAEPATTVYGADLPNFTYQVSGFVNGDTASVLSGAPSFTTDATSASGVGDYSITVSPGTLSAANYDFPPADLVGNTLTVSPAPLTITAQPATTDYGADLPLFTYQVTGFVNGDTASVLSGAPSFTTDATSASGVGDYSITVGPGTLSAANYDFPSTDLVGSTLTVLPAPLTITAEPATTVYGAALPAFTYQVSGFVNGDTASVLTGAPILTTDATPTSDVGDYSITVNLGTLAASNYVFSSSNFEDNTLTVTPAPLTITAEAETKVYGASVPTLLYQVSGFVNGDTASVLSGAPSLTTTATALSGVGDYAINVAVGTLVASNYNFPSTNLVASNLTVTPAPLTITAEAESKVYGAMVPTFTYQVSGFVNGDTASVLSGAAGLASSATAASGVGSYPISVAVNTLSAANYDFPSTNLVGAILTVTPAPLSIIATAVTKVYGAPLPALTYQVSGFVNGDTASVLSGAPSLATTATATSGVGDYAIRVGSGTLAAANYQFPASQLIGNVLAVTPATLIITAQSASRLAGEPNPAFTATYSGFVNGDTPASLASQPTLTTLATAASGPGSYAIVASGAASPNYAIEYVSGKLTVIPALVVIDYVSVQKEITGQGHKHKTVEVIVVQFSGGLNAAAAQNLDNYSLATVAHGKQKSKSEKLTQAVYNATNSTVTLTPKEQPLGFKPPLRLTIIAAGLPDSLGRPIDGDGDGQPGGNFVATLAKPGVTAVIGSLSARARPAALAPHAVDAVLASGWF